MSSDIPKSYSMIDTQDEMNLRILFTSRVSNDWTLSRRNGHCPLNGPRIVIPKTNNHETYSLIMKDNSKVWVLTDYPQKFQNDSVIGSESKKQSAESDANSDSPISLLSQLKYFLTQFSYFVELLFV